MENISENKRKRGRPLKESYPGVTIKEQLDMYDKMNVLNNIKSERGKINFVYQVKGHAALRDKDNNTPLDGEFSFIISADDLNIKTYKKTILQELGRLEDQDLIRDVAREICKYKLSTSRAITYIRAVRMGKQSEGDSLELAAIIEKMINEYNIKHSNVTNDMVLQSLNIVLNVFSENISKN